MMAYRHEHYNQENFPVFVVNHGNWDIFANETGACAAIPTKEAAEIGCKASHFGDMTFVRKELQPFGPECHLSGVRPNLRRYPS